MRFWRRRVGAQPREEDPRWFDLAEDHYWTFYALLTDEICGISGELRPLDLTVEGPVVWAGCEALRMVGVPGEWWDWGWDPDPLHWGADEYEVVVDAERGVLRLAAQRQGLRRLGGRGDPLRRALRRGDLRLTRTPTVALAGHIPRWGTSENDLRAKFREHLYFYEFR